MRKKISYLWPSLIAGALALGIFVGGKLHFNDTPERLFSSNSKKDKLNRLIDYIDYEYVDDIDTDSIVDVTVNNILEKLDPHSVYIPKEEMQQVSENMKGDFVGIGINFFRFHDTISVIRTVADGPSYKKGILPGDRILAADGDTLYGKGYTNALIVERLKGEEGSKVELTVYRKAKDSLFKVSVRRDRIPLRSVTASFTLAPKIAYIQIDRFAETTYKEFKTALLDLQAHGAEKLVLDLRDNPGGYLGIAEQMADEFLPKGKLILFTKNKKGEVDKVYATGKGSFEDKPVYVLINERSASASEIVAGALQDNDIGTIVGRRSFGKGLVQREMSLGDGSAVRLTVSRYYTPTGRSIQRDYHNGTDDYYQRFMDRYHSGELVTADSIKVADSLRFTTPKGKVVYGGGGIIPDVFVPIGSVEQEALEALDGSGMLSYFTFEHLDVHRKDFADYDEEGFEKGYRIDDILFESFVDFCIEHGFRIDFYGLEPTVKRYMKAALAEQLFGVDSHAKILSGEDPVLQKVLELDAGAVLAEKTEVP